MKKIATQFALVACAMLLAGSASAQTDTTGRPVPDTVSKPMPGDTTRMPKDKKRPKDKRKMPKDSLNRAQSVDKPTAVLPAEWSAGSVPVLYAVTGGEFLKTEDIALKASV